jgi:ADP-dependent NAD(P)H-hydrate dehydratase / NAD(P)H-hydrate epimerase
MENNYVLTSVEMSAVDKYTIDKMRISGFSLMKTAGKSVYEELKSDLKKNDRIIIVSGKGNNGGDGFVVCKYLYSHDYNVDLWLLPDKAELKGDAKAHFELLLKTGFSNFVNKFDSDKYSFLIDAIFGTGFTGDLDNKMTILIKDINDSHCKIVSIDIASGLDGNTGLSKGIKANKTIVIGAYKLGHLINNGPQYSGKLVVRDIGFPKEAFEQNTKKRYKITKDELRTIFPKRNPLGYKHQFGKVLVVGGLKEMSGAVIMAAISALKSGCGLVKVVTSEEVYATSASKQLELMINPIFKESQSELNEISQKNFNDLCDWADTIVFGMGIGKHPIYKQFFEIISRKSSQLVIDAEGIDLLKNYTFSKDSEVIITPHLGEFQRLKSEELTSNLLDDIEETVKKYGVHCLLKGKTTIIYTKEGVCYFDTGGTSGLATAGSGDILSGLIAGFSAQSKSLTIAARVANYLHGRSAEIGSEKLTDYCFTATDILTFLPKAIKEIIR